MKFTVSIERTVSEYYSRDFEAETAEAARALAETELLDGVGDDWTEHESNLQDEHIADVRPAVAPRSVPYPEFCSHPDKCAGLSSCPRDPNCCE